MRNLLLICAFIILNSPGILKAQCNPYFNYQEGTTLTQTNFNHKGKEESSQKMSIVSVETSGNTQIMHTDVTIYDKKGKEVTQNQMDLICEDGVFKMDMSRFIPEGLGEAQGMSVSFEGDDMELPNELTVGKTLSDAKFKVNIESDNPALSSMMGGTETSITNRKVIAKKSITTAAGTFDCFKISYNTKVETKMMGMSRGYESKGVEWISEGVGLVRSEHYDKKGDLSGYTELTSFSK